MIVNVYVDGFNLYYGMVAGQPYKWLDIEKFAHSMLQPDDTVRRIWYCTADVDGRSDADAPERQRRYFRALETLPSVKLCKGTFRTTYPYMKPKRGGARVQVRKSEEKGSDVNLASHLLMDAFRGDFEAALVISNDSDLVTPIEMVTGDFGLQVGVAFPLFNPGRTPSVELQQVASFMRFIKNERRWVRQLERSQFPDVMSDAGGLFEKPHKWTRAPY